MPHGRYQPFLNNGTSGEMGMKLTYLEAASKPERLETIKSYAHFPGRSKILFVMFGFLRRTDCPGRPFNAPRRVQFSH